MEKVTIKEVENLIDITSFKKVLNYVNDSFSDIDNFVNVEKENLSEIGVLFIEGNTEKIKELFYNKQITFRVLPNNEAVDVLYLPPYYLVKSLNKEYK